VAIIAGGFLVHKLGSPLPLLLILVAAKIGLDLKLHRRSHRDGKSKTHSAGQ
jgi:hypothetical protein